MKYFALLVFGAACALCLLAYQVTTDLVTLSGRALACSVIGNVIVLVLTAIASTDSESMKESRYLPPVLSSGASALGLWSYLIFNGMIRLPLSSLSWNLYINVLVLVIVSFTLIMADGRKTPAEEASGVQVAGGQQEAVRATEGQQQAVE